MSYERALKTIHLQPTDRVAQNESLDHPAFMQALAGYDPWSNPLQAYVDAYKALDVDWIYGLPKSSVRFAPGQSSQAGSDGIRYTEWGLSGSVWHEEFPFPDVESVLAYDPVAAISAKSNQQSVASRRADQALMGDSAIVTGLYYTTLFQFPILTFGWELFLTAAAAEPERFQRVLEGFAEVTRRNLSEWAKEDLDLIVIHDDVAMERGPVFHPDWYRKRLFPLYEILLEPLKDRTKTKVGFISDGDYTPLLDDLVSLGFDGFLINANMDLGSIARRIGRDHFLIGNVDTAILTFGTPDDVVREVKRCLEDGRACAGHFMKAVGDLPHNVPLANIRTYFDAVAQFGRRSG
ncbi:MAG: uroporphyrinogen decarboxylase family protein [Candidatus Latescibacterota bacterium]